MNSDLVTRALAYYTALRTGGRSHKSALHTTVLAFSLNGAACNAFEAAAESTFAGGAK